MKHVLSIICTCICITASSQALAVDRTRIITVNTPVVAATCTVGNDSVDFGTFGVQDLGDASLSRTATLPLLCDGTVTPTGLVFSSPVGTHASGNFVSSVSGMSYEVHKDTDQLGLTDGTKINNTANLLTGVAPADRMLGRTVINYGVRITPVADVALNLITPTAGITDSINVTLTY